MDFLFFEALNLDCTLLKFSEKLFHQSQLLSSSQTIFEYFPLVVHRKSEMKKEGATKRDEDEPLKTKNKEANCSYGERRRQTFKRSAKYRIFHIVNIFYYYLKYLII